MMKHILTATALAAVVATPAFAQPKPAANPGNLDQSSMSSQSTGSGSSFVQTQHATDWRGSKLIGATVYGPDNASIGDISDVLVSNDGRIRAVVIGVGGFLSVGQKDVAIPFEQLQITRKSESSSIDKVKVSYSKDELKNAPTFAYYDPNPSRTTGSNSNQLNDSSQK